LSQVRSGRVWKIQIPFPCTGVRTSVRPACRNSLYPLPDRQCRRVPFFSKWKLPCTEIPINFYLIILPFDSVTTRLGAGRSIFDSRQGKGTFLFSKISRRSGPTQLPIKWVSGFFHGINRPGRGADHSSPPSAEVKNGWSHTSTPPACLQSLGRDFVFFIIRLEN